MANVVCSAGTAPVLAGLLLQIMRSLRVLGFLLDRLVFPILRNLIGRTLYVDMARMEDFLASCVNIARRSAGNVRLGLYLLNWRE